MYIKYSIKPFIRMDKIRNGKCPIYYRVILNKDFLKFSSGKEIESGLWDSKTGLAKRGCGHAQFLNGVLKKRMAEFEEYMLKMENLGVPMSKSKIKDFFHDTPQKNFYQFFQEQIDLWLGKKKEGTLNSYRNTLKILKLFKFDLDFGDINYELVQKWEHYLINVRKNSINGMLNRHKCFKKIIREAILKGFLTSNPYNHFPIRHTESNRQSLTSIEVKKVIELELPKNHAGLDRVKDMFLFSCFSGLRYSDLVSLRWTHIDFETKFIKIKMKKTDKYIKILLIEPLSKILLKYWKGQNDNELIFKTISNQAANRSLKILIALTGIKKTITFHCGRHSFACNHLEADTHIMYLKDLLGHSSVEQTQIYAKSLQRGLDDSMNKFEKMFATA